MRAKKKFVKYGWVAKDIKKILFKEDIGNIVAFDDETPVWDTPGNINDYAEQELEKCWPERKVKITVEFV